MAKTGNYITDLPSSIYHRVGGTKRATLSLRWIVNENGYPIIHSCESPQELKYVDYELPSREIKDFKTIVHKFQINKESPLKEGDILYAIDDNDTRGNSIQDMLTGYMGTEAKLSVVRRDEGVAPIILKVKVLRDRAITNSTSSQMIATLQILHTRLVALEEKHML